MYSGTESQNIREKAPFLTPPISRFPKSYILLIVTNIWQGHMYLLSQVIGSDTYPDLVKYW
jgi:hypothetical protein